LTDGVFSCVKDDAKKDVKKMLEIMNETYYTIKDLTEGFVVSRSSVYEMMNNGLRYSRFGGKRVILGKNLKEYLEGSEVRAN
jgi:hypothetical protein